MHAIEPFAQPATTWRRLLADIRLTTLANACVGFVFAASGPVAIILAVGSRGGLDPQTLSSWIFGAFFVNGLLSLIACWFYRMPLVFFWTIPGTVLVGPALSHLSIEEVAGAYLVTGILMAVLGVSGWIRRAMQAVPMPVVMGMVAGVFLQFGLDWILALRADILLAGAMTLGYFTLLAVPALGRFVPPLIGALLIGVAVLYFGQRLDELPQSTASWVTLPTLISPVFSWPAMVELVVPLAVTVLVVQNAQGVAVVAAAGHRPPINFITLGCGLWSLASAFVGAVSTCLTGPVNALISSSGPPASHYAAGMLVGLLALVFGLCAPLFTAWMLVTPPEFIATIAGLALLNVLQTAFRTAFAGTFSISAMVTFLITVADISIANIGAPFWGLLIGFIVSRSIERAG